MFLSSPSPMTSSKPYLLRALYEWILYNNCTPHILLDATFPEVHVPMEYVQDGQIVFNVSQDAVQNLNITNEQVHFFARFSGVARAVSFPVEAVLAIYARENGHGMAFPEENTVFEVLDDEEEMVADELNGGSVEEDSPPPGPSPAGPGGKRRRPSAPNLVLVK